MARPKKDAIDRLLKKAEETVNKKFRDNELSGRAWDILSRPTSWASTGSLVLDYLCTGAIPGGIPIGPQGRIVHLVGDWSTGKSLILDHIFKSVLDKGGLCLCSETEGTRDPHFAEAIGLDLTKVTIQRPESIEQLFDAGIAWHNAIREAEKEEGLEHAPIVWGVDSLDSVESGKTLSVNLSEGGGWHYGGGRAEALGAGLRKVTKLTSRYPTSLVLLNQTRENVGVLFGPKKRSPGGNPPHFYASLELWLSPISGAGGVVREEIEANLSKNKAKELGANTTGRVVARWVKAEVKKTKLGPTFDMSGRFLIDFDKGIVRHSGVSGLLAGLGLLGQDGRQLVLTLPGFEPRTFKSVEEVEKFFVEYAASMDTVELKL